MSETPVNTLLLNRQARLQLLQAGLKDLSEVPVDLNVARRLALWRQSSGAEAYLYSLFVTASRALVLRFFVESNLHPGLDKAEIAGKIHSLPELGHAYQDLLFCYPRPELTQAIRPGRSKQHISARMALLGELYIIDLLTENPATRTLFDLFDDSELKSRFDYHDLINRVSKLTLSSTNDLFNSKTLPELLREPMRAAPKSLSGQVAYMIDHWQEYLPDEVLLELKQAGAIAAEEHRPHLPGPGPYVAPLFGTGDGSDAPAAFTADIDWMPSAVLLAKSVYVWLDQLSSRYCRTINRLDQIPDEELACLSRWGFNSLWLIGIWERSAASKRIKQLDGNPEAEASAYALHAYRVAADLGGDQALQNLEARCQQHGIRLACDVVPNHTGIDSEWVREHPDWFLQTDHPPYPGYRFTGPDLCDVDALSIRIEDGYWNHSDAAVVCEHHDHQTGRKRYIYHGNDGTQMPWNDTAQLNFLRADVRGAMSDLIVAIARRFSLIRFDAAMTLARKHFRRLWFPPHGESATVPSRSAFSISDEEFAAAFPVEFWREVVDRINREAPDTLLIAEAFWLMESYFVRNLGMHRVYNSAFMNLLKQEENAKYRKILKDTLAYNPEILKRYVNFMNNPDEATAVEQFDKGDKYFGVATLLVTLPGLPMFGHGQVEGYQEKYGMEYRRAYWDETPDSGFISHHERQIFPLLRNRHLFADVENFSFYDFITPAGVNEHVYAFSNGPIGQKILVVYNNSGQTTSGRIYHAAAKAPADREGQAEPMPPLPHELGLNPNDGEFCRFRSLTGNEYLRRTSQLEEGIELHLEGYENRVLHDFELFEDLRGDWSKLEQRLQGRPVENLDLELLQMRYQPLWQSFTSLLSPRRLHLLGEKLSTSPSLQALEKLTGPIETELLSVASQLRTLAAADLEKTLPLTSQQDCFPLLTQWLKDRSSSVYPMNLMTESWSDTSSQHGLCAPILAWLLIHKLGKMLGLGDDGACMELLSQFGLDFALQRIECTREPERALSLTSLLLRTSALSPHPACCETAFSELCHNHENADLLGINSHAGERWFSRQGLTALASSIALQAEIMQLLTGVRTCDATTTPDIIADRLRHRLARAAAVGYRLDKFLLLS